MAFRKANFVLKHRNNCNQVNVGLPSFDRKTSIAILFDWQVVVGQEMAGKVVETRERQQQHIYILYKIFHYSTIIGRNTGYEYMKFNNYTRWT